MDNYDLFETWKPVFDQPNYEISDFGRVRSLDHYVECRGGYTKLVRGRLLKPQSQTSGHLHIQLCLNGEIESRCVHVIVAREFIGVRPDGMEVCHRNGVPTDNRAMNLYYGSRRQNNLDMYIHKARPTGEMSHLATYSDDFVADLRKMKGFFSSRQAGAIVGVRDRYVRQVWSNKIRTHQQ